MKRLPIRTSGRGVCPGCGTRQPLALVGGFVVHHKVRPQSGRLSGSGCYGTGMAPR